MDQPIPLERREVLRATTGILTGLVIAGSPLAIVARGCAWAVDLTAFTSLQGAALLAVALHDKLDDAAYALVVQAMDNDASKDENLRKIIGEGVSVLGPKFASGSKGSCVEALKKIEQTPFFQVAEQSRAEDYTALFVDCQEKLAVDHSLVNPLAALMRRHEGWDIPAGYGCPNS